ncbi:MAG: 2'-5' RNA ligase family protein [Tyzzerella sp.]|nr:2'-5' RNA ligase family protein [Tyzzerella sp.]
MYLVSIYFNEKTNKRIQQYINKVAEHTGNQYMIEEKVPPHITISAFETTQEEEAILKLEEVVKKLKCGKLTLASVGQFFPYVMYVTPVLNEYLHEMAVMVGAALSQMDKVKISPYYQPFQWLPHVTIGKKLTKEEMQIAFEIIQNSFGAFEGEVVKIGLAKPNPHRDIVSWELE